MQLGITSKMMVCSWRGAVSLMQLTQKKKNSLEERRKRHPRIKRWEKQDRRRRRNYVTVAGDWSLLRALNWHVLYRVKYGRRSSFSELLLLACLSRWRRLKTLKATGFLLIENYASRMALHHEEFKKLWLTGRLVVRHFCHRRCLSEKVSSF